MELSGGNAWGLVVHQGTSWGFYKIPTGSYGKETGKIQ